jgi:hypothetical protein
VNCCTSGCPRERVQQDPQSLGIIADAERIARGAFDPSHGDARKLKIRPGLIARGNLYLGECSVWRLAPLGIHVADLVPRLENARSGQKLFAISARMAGEIRAIKFGDGDQQAFCVVDECECDQEGNKHEAHAHIAFCREAIKAGCFQDDPRFTVAHRELITILQQGDFVWTNKAA